MQGRSSERRRLSPREREVLDSIVLQYIHSGVPVGSRTVSKTNSENLSPATIRSIMADLEEAGYITHPHTSAGRVPTDLGYRHYVDSLAGRPKLAAAERRSLAENLYATGGLDSLLSRCCRLLAAASHQIGVGTSPDATRTVYRHVELLKLSDERILVLFIATSGLVHQHVIESRAPETPADLERYARYLNSELQGRTLGEVRDRLAELMRQERATYDALVRRALQLGAQYFARDLDSGAELYVDGAEQFFERPDLGEFDRMKSLIGALEDKSRILRLLSTCLEKDGVTTAIGSETAEPELVGCAIVATSYGFDQTPVGTLGIIGPTRMDYDRAMALVQHVAELLGTALASARR